MIFGYKVLKMNKIVDFSGFCQLYEGTTNLVYSKNDSQPIESIFLIYGGLSYATPTWMQTQVKSSYPELEKRLNVVYAPYNLDFKNVESQIKSKWGQNANIRAIAGFSAGGKTVLNATTRDFDFIGLIDPSLLPNNSDYGNKKFSKSTYMLWGSPGMIQIFGGDVRGVERYEYLSSLVQKSGGLAERYTKDHNWFVGEFFKRFGPEAINKLTGSKLPPIASSAPKPSTPSRKPETIGGKTQSNQVTSAGTAIQSGPKAPASFGSKILSGLVKTTTGMSIDPGEWEKENKAAQS